ncbi:MAG TPA: nucleotide sugar dehydrogenase, partial [Stenotrophomonas sp.]|nr:nucleotide sugar dehydrogenase [Stenotrophomonas sp.]
MAAAIGAASHARIGVIGLGYVGLPLTVAFGCRQPTLGYDIDRARVLELQQGHDHTLEMEPHELAAAAQARYSDDPAELATCNVYIVTVPTPIDAFEQPDLGPLRSASTLIAGVLKPGDLVIYESTVYPGTTEEVCVPLLEAGSGLRFNQDFYCGYSPERINPGDRQRRLPDIRKITSGSTVEVAAVVDALYAAIITAGTWPAPSIRVAEAAKVIENIQRDVNIA